MIKKCAVYTRVSTAMQAEVEYNSCEVQKNGAEGQNRTAHACLFRAALYH